MWLRYVQVPNNPNLSYGEPRLLLASKEAGEMTRGSYPATCSKCFRDIDLNACGRAIKAGQEFRHGCGRVLVMAKVDRWWEKDRG